MRVVAEISNWKCCFCNKQSLHIFILELIADDKFYSSCKECKDEMYEEKMERFIPDEVCKKISMARG